MEIKDFEQPSNVKIKIETQEEVSEVKSCFIWIAENCQPNLLKENSPPNFLKENSPPNLLKENSHRHRRKVIKIRRCSVATCKNVSSRKDLMFHKFPANERIREIWVKLCGRTDEYSVNNALICSDHFETKHYVNRKKQTGCHSRLLSGVIPSINLPEIVPFISGHSPEFEEDDTLSEESRTFSSLTNEDSNSEEDEDVIMLDGYNREEDKPTPHSPPWLQIDSVMSTLSCGLLVSQDEKISSLGDKCNLDNIVEPRTKNTDDCEIITISSEDDDVQLFNDDINGNSLKCQTANLTADEKLLSLFKNKYQTLEKSFHELKVKTNEEIDRLNSIIKDKEEEYSRELKEILSLFLKPAKVTEVVSQAVW